jgi:hypothetical protein
MHIDIANGEHVVVCSVSQEAYALRLPRVHEAIR